jgi:DeoR/GlpR family transcriptional regulator of sugar metabolism
MVGHGVVQQWLRVSLLMAGSSKFGRSGFIEATPFSEIHILITDTGFSIKARD